MFFIGPVFEYRAYIDLADLNGVEIITFPETSDLLSICASTTITFFPYETCNLALLLNMVPSCSMEASIFGDRNKPTKDNS
jgi:hypothetical protein